MIIEMGELYIFPIFFRVCIFLIIFLISLPTVTQSITYASTNEIKHVYSQQVKMKELK